MKGTFVMNIFKKIAEEIRVKISFKVRFNNTEQNSVLPNMAEGGTDIKFEEFIHACEFLTDIGVFIVDANEGRIPHGFFIRWKDSISEPKFIGSVGIEMNKADIIRVYKLVRKLGTTGLIIVGAFLDAIINVDKETFDILLSKGNMYNIIEYISDFLKMYRLPRSLNKKAMNTIHKSLGGYLSIRSLFLVMIYEYKELLTRHSYQFEPTYSECTICKYCTTMSDGQRLCSLGKAKLHKPTNIESVAGIKKSNIIDQYISSCPDMKDQRPFKPTVQKQNDVAVTFSRNQIRVISNNNKGNHGDEQIIM